MSPEDPTVMARQAEREEKARRELFAVLAHELRSPIGAILGFEELLSEGLFGEIPAAGTDALTRIRSSARQLLDLVAGLSDLSIESNEPAASEYEDVESLQLARDIIAALAHEAAGRETTVELQPDLAPLPPLRTDVDRLRRALQLTLMAAIKSTAGGAVLIDVAGGDDGVVFTLAHTRLDPARDDPEYSLHAVEGAHLTGAGLRIAMARSSLALIGGRLDFVPEASGLTLRVFLPSTHGA